MLIRFTDDYENYLFEARAVVGRLQAHIAGKEPFVGGSLELDKFYALSVAISAIVDHIEYEDNGDPDFTENLLYNLKELLSKDICNVNTHIPQRPVSTMPEPVDVNKLKKNSLSSQPTVNPSQSF